MYVFVLGDPKFLSSFIEDSILVWVVVGSGAWRGSEEMWEEVGFWEDEKGKDAVGRSRWGRRWDSGDGGGDDRWWKVLNGDVS